MGVIIEIAGALLFGIVVTSIKKLSNHGVPHILSPFYYGASMIVSSPAMSFVTPSLYLNPSRYLDPVSMFYLVGAGLGFCLGQYGMT